jgi:F0F1-type ATP synthase membrane subunit b/b'
MDNDLERQQLAHADRNIVQARAHVVRQRQIVLDLLLADQPREEAASLLERLEESLRAFERQRQLILDRFQRAE